MGLKTISDYSQMQRERLNDHAVDFEAACRLVHPDFRHAAEQAPAFCEYVLSELIYASSRYPAFWAKQLVSAYRHLTQTVPDGLLSTLALRVLKETRSLLPGTRALTVLDFGCGVGRLMRPFAVLGARVDGVDISSKMISYARQDPLLSGSRFFVSNGVDCGDAPSAFYDLCFSALCFQHICVREIRMRILEDIRRVLKPGGVIVAQYHFYPAMRDANIPLPHASWQENRTDATETNGTADVWITEDSIGQVLEDYRTHFSDVRFTFCEFPPEATLHSAVYNHQRFEHLIVAAIAGGPHRARQIYRPLWKNRAER